MILNKFCDKKESHDLIWSRERKKKFSSGFHFLEMKKKIFLEIKMWKR